LNPAFDRVAATRAGSDLLAAEAVLAVQDGTGERGAVFLAAFSLVSVMLSPFAAAASVRLNLAT